MHEKMNLLRELQEVDRELAEIAGFRTRHESEMQTLTMEKERIQGMVDELNAQLDLLLKEDAQLQLDLVKEKDQIVKVESRLPGIQTQKEYVAVLKEIDLAKKASLETQAKTAVKGKEVAELQADLAEKQAELAVIAEKCSARQAEISALLKGNDEKSSARQSTRDSLAKDLPQPLLRKYQQIFARRGGLAVVCVAEGTCLGCNIQLPPQQYNRLHLGTEMQSCPHCNRLLYMETA